MSTQGNYWLSDGRGRGGAVGFMQGYGQPTNRGRGMFGRCGIVPGRGGGMPGRGPIMTGRGQMMPGRGGRGEKMPGRGQMMPGRGGGRGGRIQDGGGRDRRMNGVGGRMALARGRGGQIIPGRGGRGRRPAQKIPSKLDIFNKYIAFKISGFCNRDEQEMLGYAFPQLTPAQLTPQQQKTRMMKRMIETKNEIANPYGVNDNDFKIEADAADAGNDVNLQNDTDMTETTKESTETCNSGPMVTKNINENSKNDSIAFKKQESPINNSIAAKSDPVCQDGDLEEKNDDEKDNTNDDFRPEQSIETEMDPEKKKQMMKAREENLRINMTDCHTLLAQLNTKRLYRRIKYFKRNDRNYNIDKAYAYNKDTVKIADLEWEDLIVDYKERKMAEIKKLAIEEAEKAEKRARSKRSKRKKKKGKGRKLEKAKKAPLQVVEEGEAESTEKQEDDANIADENDSKNGNDSDDNITESISNADDESTEKVDYVFVGEKPSKYELLMFTPCPRAVAVLASYPRSGNSLMRNLYEKITLRVTGSDMMGGLQKHDLVGEMATGTKNVQFVKTHYPERMGHPAFRVSRAVLLVRNPYDAMDSYFNLMSTNTHTTSLTAEARKKYAKLFGDMAKKEILVWRDFHEYWLKQKIPLMVVRYEDLIRDTVKVVSHVIKFVLEINSMTFFEDRIQRSIGDEQVEKLGPYKARSGGIGKSLTKGNYTPELLNQINYGIMSTMGKFGYQEMLIPKPSSWNLKPLDQWGVYIPGKSKEPMIINQKGLVRGPNRQTDWRMVKQLMKNDIMQEEKQESEKETAPKKVDLL